MDSEWIVPPPSQPEARIRLELTENELRALINRLVPANTWMKAKSDQLIESTFPGGWVAADRAADRLTDQLIRAHDHRHDGRWMSKRGAIDPEAHDG
jgi:ubiquinone biosynthesis protein COQ9